MIPRWFIIKINYFCLDFFKIISMQLKHLRNNSIDYDAWDNCISKAFNSLPYAYSWYLDIVSPDWEAIVSNNYEYVMPLPVKSKYKIPYLVQPVLCQQLGIFSHKEITEDIVEKFIKKIPYQSYEINLNESNMFSNALIADNYTLDLSLSYSDITNSYSKNTIRNIEKAEKQFLKVRESLNFEEFIDFYFENFKKATKEQKFTFKKIIQKGISQNAISLFGVYSQAQILVSALCVLCTQNRLIYLLPVSSNEGKNLSAMFLLVDFIIKKEASKKKILDFEGSAIDGIARFYKGFGAKDQPYYILKRFRPSFLIKNPLIK